MPVQVDGSTGYKGVEILKEETERLIHAAKALVEAISFDVNGAMIGGKWMGGNGGLISPQTIRISDELRRAIASIESLEKE